MMQRERSDVYIIPPNFAKEGTLFSGRIEGRNAFEAAVLFIVLFRILFFIDVSIKIIVTTHSPILLSDFPGNSVPAFNNTGGSRC